jgi:Holliday junction resolvase RusA-like endonuclease
MSNFVNLLVDEEEDEECEITAVVSPRTTLPSTPLPSTTPSLQHYVIYNLKFEGSPIAKKRPKSAPTRGRGGMKTGRFYAPRTYDPQKAITTQLRVEARRQLQEIGIKEFPIFTKDIPCVLEIEFYRRLPNESFVADDRKRSLRDALSRLWNCEDTKTPDVDNLAKMYLDALQEIVYENDSQVSKLIATKMLDVEPPHEGRTLIWVKRLQRTDLPQPLSSACNKSINRAQRLKDK